MSDVRRDPGGTDAILSIRTRAGSPPVLEVAGEIDIASAGELAGALKEALTEDPNTLVDMAGVTFIDLSGLRAVLATAESLDGSAPLTVVNAPMLARILDLLDIDGLPSLVVRDMEWRGR